MKKYLITLVAFIILCACQEKDSQTLNNSQEVVTNLEESKGGLQPNQITPIELINFLKKDQPLNFFTVANAFPVQWVKYEDVEKLMPLIDSEEECAFLTNPLNSNLNKEKGNVGGFAIWMIKSFKNNTKLDIGLYVSEKTNPKEVEALKSWWGDYKSK
jgi:hypothetical protein